MESFQPLSTLSLRTLGTGLMVIYIVYVVALAVYRLYLSPLAKFPGPRLAALTRWYEFYYDVLLRGQFSFHIEDLHKKYGPIVRITPFELHINKCEFWDTIYVKHPKSRKYDYLNARFGNEASMFTTCDPSLHRIRRAPLNPMQVNPTAFELRLTSTRFSKRAVGQCEQIVQDRIAYMGERLVEYMENDKVVPTQKMWSAMAGDIITEYAFGFHYNQLGSDDFVETFHEPFLAAGEFGNIALQFPTVAVLFNQMPDSWQEAMNPQLQRLTQLRRDLRHTISKISGEINDSSRRPDKPTIFHEILDSNLPAAEKANSRLADEAQLVIGAGLSTTAWALTNAVYYILADPSILEKLRAELFAAIPDINEPKAFHLQNLESLPYLRGCVREGVRLSNALSGRIPRIMSFPLEFEEWMIPPNTPVSMNIRDIHYNESIYPKPSEFIPERWMGDPKAPDGESLEKYWVAFGKGPRMCIGINLAYMELFTGLAFVFRRFSLELYETDITDVELKHDFLLPSPRLDSKGVRVKVRAREEK